MITDRKYPPLSRDEYWTWLFAESVAAGDDVGDLASIYGVEPYTVAQAAKIPVAELARLRERQISYERWAVRLRRFLVVQ